MRATSRSRRSRPFRRSGWSGWSRRSRRSRRSRLLIWCEKSNGIGRIPVKVSVVSLVGVLIHLGPAPLRYLSLFSKSMDLYDLDQLLPFSAYQDRGKSFAPRRNPTASSNSRSLAPAIAAIPAASLRYTTPSPILLARGRVSSARRPGGASGGSLPSSVIHLSVSTASACICTQSRPLSGVHARTRSLNVRSLAELRPTD